jgi:hypothetical protein
MKWLRLIISILSMLSLPPVILVALTNTQVKDFSLLGISSAVLLIVVAWFVTETFYGEMLK